MERMDWLKARQKGIGGSDVAAILKIPGAYRTPFDVWLEKTSAVEDTKETPAQKRGRLLEAAVASWYAEETGAILAVGEAMVGPEPWMLGTPDRLVLSGVGGYPLHGLEIKTARHTDGWAEDGAEATGRNAGDIVPPVYALQCLWYMAVSNLDRWDVAVLFMGTDEFRRYTIYRDAVYEQSALIAPLRAWWHRHVVGGEEPAIDGSAGASSWLLGKYRSPGEDVIDPTADDLATFEKWVAAKAARDKAEAEADALGNLLKARIGSARGIRGLVNWIAVKGRESLDTKRLRAEMPDVAARYTTIGEPTRSLRIAGGKK